MIAMAGMCPGMRTHVAWILGTTQMLHAGFIPGLFLGETRLFLDGSSGEFGFSILEL